METVAGGKASQRVLDKAAAKVPKGKIQSHTIQQYIDETPLWADGTEVSTAAMTMMQWRIWLLAAAGKFFEGMVIFMSGVALPLIAAEFQLGATGHGLVTAAGLFGILVGASALGGLADSLGRKPMFVIEMALFIAFLILLWAAPTFPLVLLGLFGLGFALGCDYPTAHLIISESICSRDRGRLVLGAFSFQALGALTGTAIGYLVLSSFPEIGAWRYMYAVVIVPAVVVLIGRFFITESPHWLIVRERPLEARQALLRLLKRNPPYPHEVNLTSGKEQKHRAKNPPRWRDLFTKPKARKATILASIPWFLQDLGTYGIGIFTPVILASTFGHKTENATAIRDIIHNDILAAKGTAFIDLLLIVGMAFAVILSDRAGRIPLQILGFGGCAIGLFIASLSNNVGPEYQLPMIFAGFMVFNFMTNLGPNAQTYLIAGEVFPTKLRAMGAGLAASIAKMGAVTTAFLFPVLLSKLGIDILLYGLIAACILGAFITWRYRIETRRVSLESIDKHHSED